MVFDLHNIICRYDAPSALLGVPQQNGPTKEDTTKDEPLPQIGIGIILNVAEPFRILALTDQVREYQKIRNRHQVLSGAKEEPSMKSAALSTSVFEAGSAASV